MAHTHRHTIHGHRDSETESAQWANSVEIHIKWESTSSCLTLTQNGSVISLMPCLGLGASAVGGLAWRAGGLVALLYELGAPLYGGLGALTGAWGSVRGTART